MDGSMRVLIFSAAALLAAPCAIAQTPAAGPDALTKDVACAASAAKPALDANVRKELGDGQGARSAMAARLNQISSDSTVCGPVRDAAKDLASTYAAADPASGPTASHAPNAAVAEALAEAQRRLANLKFEVGPPPRNMTKGRTSGT